MITFWIAAVLASAVALGLIALLAARPVAVASDPSRTVYRRQLAEIDDLATRGLLGEDERKSAHAEAARRLLGEDDPSAERPSPAGARTFIWGVAGLTGVCAFGLYLLVGRPNMPDQPFSKRLAEWTEAIQKNPESLQSAQIVALLENRLRTDTKKEVTNNPSFLEELADWQNRTGNPVAAERNLERAITLTPASAVLWEELGQTRVDMAQGEVTPAARVAFEKAVSLDPKVVLSRFWLAGDDVKKGRVEQGIAAWRALLPELPPEGQTVVNEKIAAAERGATQPAAAQANPAILAMVQGLAERLKTNPNDPEGWARVVRSYAVLGDQAKLNEALTDARRYFKDRPRELQAIEAGVNTPASAPGSSN